MPTIAELSARIEVEGAGPAAAELGAFGKQIDTTAKKSGVAVKSHAQHDAAMRKMGTGALVAGGLLAAGVGVAAGAAMRFDTAMSGVAAVSDANAAAMGRLREAAIDAGQATVFSASEAAQAEAELAKAGVSTADILGGALTGSLDLAAAGQLELANAATISAQAMNIFNLSGKDVSHIADVLAAGANKSAADVGQLGDALRQGGLLAKQTGLDLEDTVGVLSLFADNALIGSDAGTSLKAMLQRLTPQSAEAREEMERLGISAYDAQGQFIGIEKFAGNLRRSLAELTPEARNAALGIIFGSDAVRSANILYEAGEKQVRNYIRSVDDQGAASRMAATQMDNLGGDIEQLGGSIETALIKNGSTASGVLRFLAQGATDVVNSFTNAPEPIQATVLAIMGLSAATLLIGGLVIKVDQFKKSLDLASPAMGSFVGKVGSLAATASAVGTLAVIVGQVGKLTRGVEDVNVEIDKLSKKSTKQLVKEFDALIQKRAELVSKTNDPVGIFDWVPDAINPMQLLGDEVDKAGIGLKLFRDIAEGNLGTAKRLRDAIRENGGETDAYDKIIRRTAEGQRRAAADTDTATGAVQENAGAQRDGAKAIREAEEALEAYKAALDSVLGINASAVESELQFKAALAELNEEIAAGTFNLDTNTAEGARNQLQLQSIATQAVNTADAVYRQTLQTQGQEAATNAANMVLADHANQLMGAAQAAGLDEAAAAKLTGTLLGIPPETLANINSNADLQRELVRLFLLKFDEVNGRESTARINVDTYYTEFNKGAAAQGYTGPSFGPEFGAAGALVDRPTLFMAGEAGPEAVVPLGPSPADRRNRDRVMKRAGLFHIVPMANGGVAGQFFQRNLDDRRIGPDDPGLRERFENMQKQWEDLWTWSHAASHNARFPDRSDAGRWLLDPGGQSMTHSVSGERSGIPSGAEFDPFGQFVGDQEKWWRGYQHGGWVDAPRGMAVPAILHGGEYVQSAAEARTGGAAAEALERAADKQLQVLKLVVALVGEAVAESMPNSPRQRDRQRAIEHFASTL